MTTVWDLVAEAKDLSTANPKHMGILCAVSSNAFPTQDGSLMMPEYCFTLREWRNIANAASEVTQEECIEMFPELGNSGSNQYDYSEDAYPDIEEN